MESNMNKKEDACKDRELYKNYKRISSNKIFVG
jgi:hypothetical protein